MKANRAVRARFQGDERGTNYIIEVMIVAMFIGMVIVVWDPFTWEMHDPDQDLPVSKDFAGSILTAWSGKPSSHQDIQFSHHLEQLVVEIQAGGPAGWAHEDYMSQLLKRSEWHLALKTELGQIPIVGPTPGRVHNAVNQHLYKTDWGVTLIQPGLSHYNPTSPIDVTTLPLLSTQPLAQYGHPYTVEAVLKDATGRAFTTDTYGTIRTPPNQSPGHVLDLRFTDGSGVPIDTVPFQALLAEAPVPDPLNPDFDPLDVLWPVSLRIAPSPEPSARTWYTAGHGVRIHPPSEWRFHSLEDTQNWTIASEGPALRFQYNGKPVRGGDGEVVLPFTLKRQSATLPVQHEVLRAVHEGPHTGSRHLLLEALAPSFDGPLGVFVSAPDPLPVVPPHLGLDLHVTNPTGQDLSLRTLRVHVPGERALFNHLRDVWTPLAGGNYSSGQWVMTHWRADQDATFTWEGTLNVPKGKSVTLNLPISVSRTEGWANRGAMTPVLRLQDADGTVLRESVGGLPMGDRGFQEFWLPPVGADAVGELTLRVPKGATPGVPPGRGAVTVLPASLSFLDVIQEARYTTDLSVTPRFHVPGEPVTVRLDTGDLLAALRGINGFREDSVQVELWASDLLGLFANQPYVRSVWPVDIDAAAAVIGMAWLDAGGAPDHLVVAYADGNLLALHGSGLPDVSLWRVDLGSPVTAGPIVVEQGGVPVVKVATRDGSQHVLWTLDRYGAVIGVNGGAGWVSHLIPVPCAGADAYGYFLQVSEARQVGPGGSIVAPFTIEIEDIVSSRVAAVSGGQVRQGPLNTGNAGKYLEFGSFGPFGQCSLVAGYVDGFVERVDAAEGKRRWWTELGSPLRGLWVEDVRTLPLEEAGRPWSRGQRSDEVLVVTEDHGYEVYSGWVYENEQRTLPVPVPGLLPGDSLVGVSFQNGTHGAAVSKQGHVWRTEDAGRSWEKVVAPPVVEPPGSIIDFALGGNGAYLFVRDDKMLRDAPPEVFAAEWRSLPLGMEYRGVSETETGPAVLYQDLSHHEVVLGLWNQDIGRPGASVRNLGCGCPWTLGHPYGLIGATGTTTFVNSTNEWTIGQKSHAGSISADGRAIIRHGAMIYFIDDGNATEFSMWSVPAEGFLDSKPGRHPAFSSLAAQKLLIAKNEGEVLSFHDGLGRLSGVASGLGTRLLLREDATIRFEPGHTHWFFPVVDQITEGSSVDVNLHGHASEWRWHAPGTTASWTPAGETRSVVWHNESFIEYRRAADTATAFSMTFNGVVVTPSTIPECSSCLRPVAPQLDVSLGRGVFADPIGGLPRVSLPSLDADPVVVRTQDALVLFAGNVAEGIVMYDAATGIPLNEANLEILPGDSYRYLKVVSPSGPDQLWVLSGSNPETGGDLARFYGPRAGSPYRVSHVNTITGELEGCSAVWTESFSLDGRLALHPRHAAEGPVFGTDLGYLRAAAPTSDCAGWAASPLGAGSVMQWQFVPEERVLGPQIVRTTLRFSVEGFGEIEVYHLGYTNASTSSERAVGAVYLTVILYHWYH